MDETKLTKRRGTCSLKKKKKLKGYQNNAYILVTKFVVFFSTKMKEKIKVKYLIIPPLSGN